MKQRKEYISILAVLVLIITIVGISYASFTYTGTGKILNTITTGAISMSYEESSNVISMDKALPTTDATGKKQLKAGEYFDFTVAGNIVGGETINWEIAAEDVTSSTKKIDGSHIKLYLTSINSSGVETEVMAPTIYKSLTEANNDTGRPANQMSLATGTIDTSFSTKYRLRMYVDESYNPQGDGGNLSFSVKVNVYGKSKAKPVDTVETLIAKANPETVDYNNATTDQKNQMWTFPHEATEQLKATTDYRYIGANPNNYVKFNDELWRIIGVFDVDDGTGKIEKRMKIIKNESIGYFSFDCDDDNCTNTSNEWHYSTLKTLLNDGAYYNRTTDIYYGANGETRNIDFTSTGLNDDSKKLIKEAKWYLGATPNIKGTASDWYYSERTASRSYKSWQGKVGLIYPSDYVYATSGGNIRDRNSCIEEISSWDKSSYEDCQNNDWIAQVQWTITPRVTYEYTTVIGNNGIPTSSDTYNPKFTYPAIYLKSTIKITGGTGSSTDPFILG